MRYVVLLVLAASRCAGPESSTSTSAAAATPKTAAPATEPAAPLELTVATYNVNANERAMEETLAHLRRLDADIVLLQESSPRWEKALRRDLGSLYPHMEFRPWREPWGSRGVLSKRPWRDAGLLPPEHGPFPAWLITVGTEQGEIDILR